MRFNHIIGIAGTIYLFYLGLFGGLKYGFTSDINSLVLIFPIPYFVSYTAFPITLLIVSIFFGICLFKYNLKGIGYFFFFMILWDTIGSILDVLTVNYVPPPHYLPTFLTWVGWAVILMVTYTLSIPKLDFHIKSIWLFPIAQLITIPAMITNPYHVFEYMSEIIWITGVLKCTLIKT